MGGETKEASLKAVVDRVAERRQQWLEDEGISVPTNLVDGGVKRALKYLEEEEVIASDTKEKMEHVWSESDQQATDAIVSLIHQGVDVKAPDGGGTIALHYAARNGHTEVLSLLLERGAEVSAQDEDRWTALHSAADNGHVEVLSLLLEGGADVSAQDKDGWTALNLAADNGYVEVLSLLLEGGADVAAQDNDGLAALHCAATSGNIKAVSLLLDRNADANAISKEGHNPLSHLILEMRDDPDDSYIAVVRLLSSLEPTLDLSLLIKSS
eukprot:jgi/Phyca11/532246/estExt2_fgenesh1_pg.C_PHYCAscaffold_40209